MQPRRTTPFQPQPLSNLNGQSLPEAFLPEVLVMRDDYPFKMETQPKAGTVPGQVYVASEYRYGFNGIGVKKRVEAASDVKGTGDSYDFGAWMYDPRVGRWWSCDPLGKKLPFNSVYLGLNNNPIVYQDPDGREGKATIRYSQGDNTKTNPNVVTISANYYYNNLSEIGLSTLTQTIGEYNNSAFVFRDGGEWYSVRFDIRLQQTEENTTAVAARDNSDNAS